MSPLGSTMQTDNVTLQYVVIMSWLPNGGHLGSTVLDFWISPELNKASAEIERKVIKTMSKVTLTWATV